MSALVRSGLDRLRDGDVETAPALSGSVGLLAHPASVDAKLDHAIDVLRAAGADLKALFGPEHGFGGEAQDMIGVASQKQYAGLPLHSLYGFDAASLAPTAEQLRGLDTVVVDLQDVGSRYYTYVWTAALTLKAAAALGIKTVVLDRPNPLGGEVVEGAPQRPGHRSFVGLYDVSVRHGMTIGEILTMVRQLEGIDEAALHIVSMQGWRRSMFFDETGLPWVMPSPNMPTLETAVVYPGGCLIEGTELSEGRGTTRPFELFGAPGLDGRALRERVRIDGAELRPTSFEPTFQKHARTRCGGVQLHVSDRRRFRSFEAYARLIAASAELLGDTFSFRHAPYEFVSEIPAIDLLSGGGALRAAIDSGNGLDAWAEGELESAQHFAAQREPWLHYR